MHQTEKINSSNQLPNKLVFETQSEQKQAFIEQLDQHQRVYIPSLTAAVCIVELVKCNVHVQVDFVWFFSLALASVHVRLNLNIVNSR
jgi:hypothetical protein